MEYTTKYENLKLIEAKEEHIQDILDLIHAIAVT